MADCFNVVISTSAAFVVTGSKLIYSLFPSNDNFGLSVSKLLLFIIILIFSTILTNKNGMYTANKNFKKGNLFFLKRLIKSKHFTKDN